jgi:hypothetical protein
MTLPDALDCDGQQAAAAAGVGAPAAQSRARAPRYRVGQHNCNPGVCVRPCCTTCASGPLASSAGVGELLWLPTPLHCYTTEFTTGQGHHAFWGLFAHTHQFLFCMTGRCMLSSPSSSSQFIQTVRRLASSASCGSGTNSLSGTC